MELEIGNLEDEVYLIVLKCKMFLLVIDANLSNFKRINIFDFACSHIFPH